MPKLQPNDEILIFINGGLHYHMPKCWLVKDAGYNSILFKDLDKYKTGFGGKYIADVCVDNYVRGLPIIEKPPLGVRRVHPSRLINKEK